MLEKRSFHIGMNQDDDVRIVPNGEYTYALNIRNGITDQDSDGSIENAKGNTQVAFTLPSGPNKCIGSKPDYKERRTIFFVWNLAGNHTIWQYLWDTNTVEKILENSLLNFDRLSLINHIDIIDDNLLHWTDNFEEPSKLNITRAKDGNYPAAFLRQYLDVIAYPPPCEPTATYGTNVNIKKNDLRGQLWQFSYKYHYPDNETSLLSPPSKVPLPEGEELNVTGDILPIYNNNFIDVTLQTGDEIVEKIELLGRAGNLGDWFIIKVLDKAELGIGDNTTHVFRFFNDEVYTSTDQSEANQLQDFVPLKAKTQSYTDGNRIVWGNITEGFDIATTRQDMINQGTLVEQNPIFPQSTNNPTLTIDNATSPTPKFTVGANVAANNIFAISLTSVVVDTTGPTIVYSETFTYTYKAESGDTASDVATELAGRINGDPPRYQGNPTVIASTVGAQVSIAEQALGPNLLNQAFLVFPKALSLAIPVRGFKRGATHPFGLMYGDGKGRWSTVIETDNMVVYADWFSETVEKGNMDMTMTIKHQPPIWAKYYQVMYAGNQTIAKTEGGRLDFIQFVTDKVTNLAGGKKRISLKPITDYAAENENSILSYGFSPGDRCRFIKSGSGTSPFYNIQKDVEVLAFDTGTNEITVEVSGITVDKGTLFELYTPKKTISERVYTEMGECFQILNPGTALRAHAGDTNQDIGSGADAVINLNEGDVYFKSRTMNDGAGPPTTELVEDPSYSDFYVSNDTHIGRANVVDDGFMERNRPNTFVWTEPYIPRDNINGLSRVLDLSEKEYDRSWGDIQRTYTENKRMILLQELKVGQVLINEDLLFDQSGESSVQKSDEFLSDIAYYDGEFGIGQNPESFDVYGFQKWFADAERGVILRLSKDGLTPISEHKMHKFFVEALRDSTTSDSTKIFCRYDKNFDDVIVVVEKEQTILGVKTVTTPSGADIELLGDVSGTQFANCFISGEAVEICVTATGQCAAVEIDALNGNTLSIIGNNLISDQLPNTGVQVKCITRQTLSFSESNVRWTSFFSYEPEMLSQAETDIISFRNGNLWRHNTNETRNNFYGVQYTSQVTLPSNDNPSSVKVFRGISEDSNEVWALKEMTTQEGQSTSLIEADFEEKENIFYAALLRDANTSSVTNPLIEGDEMRSTSAELTLEASKTTFVKMFVMGIKYLLSELTNR